MSLLIAARYRDGVVLASDPFVFDNDPARPSRRVDFDRFEIAPDQSAVFAAVGAMWVFRTFQRQFDAESARETLSPARIAEIWKNGCDEWRRGRESETHGARRGSLRELSESLLIAVRRRRPWTIDACSCSGAWTSSRTWIVTGSAAGWVRDHMSQASNRFDARDSLADCLAKVRACFTAGQRDLYVIGFPAVVCVSDDGIHDFSEASRDAWENSCEAAFSRLAAQIRREEHHRGAVLSGRRRRRALAAH